jgi:hypothetical protein
MRINDNIFIKEAVFIYSKVVAAAPNAFGVRGDYQKEKRLL